MSTLSCTLDSEWEEGDWPSARARPDSLEALVRATRFSRAELKRIYRSFKAHCPSGLVTEDSFRPLLTIRSKRMAAKKKTDGAEESDLDKRRRDAPH
ncbi:unnamed protein product [Nezara viridula]|uniref:Uncharacterized protein n=1 Tax=Nezara viridula TaxID=85310 RepID=A0A9P0HBY5_NEZVI|nr:unnamed protein product [Nezara viridula]